MGRQLSALGNMVQRCSEAALARVLQLRSSCHLRVAESSEDVYSTPFATMSKAVAVQAVG